MKTLAAALACPALLLVTVVNAAEGDTAAGQTKAAACASCHGEAGHSNNPAWPKLAGQGAPYLVKQLQDFKSGKRQNPLMSPMAASLTEQDMLDLAAYFAAQPATYAAVPSAQVEQGERLYRAGDKDKGLAACMSCHGPAGAGNAAAKFPALEGQHAAYNAAQLDAFKAGQRNNDPQAMMRSVASLMTEAEIKAVAAYLTGLHAR